MIQTAPVISSLPIECPLHQLRRGQRGRIARIEDQALRLALLRMGICEGDECLYTGSAPFRDPISILVGRTKVSIRKRDAARIWILRK